MDEDKALQDRPWNRRGLRQDQERKGRSTHIHRAAWPSVSPEERARAFERRRSSPCPDSCREIPTPEPKAEELLQRVDTAADIAMFGRMLADATRSSIARRRCRLLTPSRRTASMPRTTTTPAVDDLKSPRRTRRRRRRICRPFRNSGAGVFYLYLCVDREAAAAQSRRHPCDSGRESRRPRRSGGNGLSTRQAGQLRKPCPCHLCARREPGSAQPRSLAAAFLKPVAGSDHGRQSIAALEDFRDRLDETYGACAGERYTMDVDKG